MDMLDLLAPTDHLEVALELATCRSMHQHPHALAYRLVGRVAIQTLRATVPRRDRTVERLADDRVITRLDDGGHLRELRPRLVERRDVGEGQDHPVKRVATATR